MNDNLKLVQALEDSNILLKGITKIIKNETKEQKGGFLSMPLGTLASTLLGNMLLGKGIVRAGYENKQGKGIVRASYGNKENLLFLHMKYKSIVKISLNLMVFILQIISLKK